MADSYSVDNYIKFEHSPVNNKTAFQRETIGAHDYETLSVKSHTDTDANTIYVNTSTGNDSTGTGAKAAPYKTYLKGGNSCTVAKTKVIILNSGFVSEDFSTLSNEFLTGFYSDTGITAKYSGRVLPIVPSDANSIFVAKTGNDSDAGTAAAPKLTIAGAIAAVTATATAVVIEDSETYEEPGFEFTGNFKYLLAADQCDPTIKPLFFANNCDGGDLAEVYEYTLGGGTFDVGPRGIVELSSGNIVVTGYTATLPYFQIFYPDLTSAKSKTLIENIALTAGFAPRIEKFSNNNFIVLIYSAAGGVSYFKIYNSAGTVVKAKTDIADSTYYLCGCCVDDDDNFYIVHAKPSTTKFYIKKYDSSGTLLLTEDFDVATEATHCDCVITSDNKIIILCADLNTVIKLYLTKYDNDLSEEITLTEVRDDAASQNILEGCFSITSDDDVFIHLFNSTPGEFLLFKFDETLSFLTSQTVATSSSGNINIFNGKNVIHTNTYLGLFYNADLSDFFTFDPSYNLMSIYQLSSGLILSYSGDYKLRITYPFSFCSCLVSVASSINGISINANNNYLNKNVIKGSYPITIKNINLYNCVPLDSNLSATGIQISSTGKADIQNSIFFNSDASVYCENAEAIIKKNLFYNLTDGYSIHVKGTAASSGDIAIEYNTFFSVYGGIRLEDNGGTNELVKNNIFQDCNVYDVLAETAMTVYNSTYTGNLSNATASGCLKANALFINEGEYDADDIDLRIKKIILGYNADSPALGLALDSQDAGAYDQIEIGDVDTWTAATIEKPINGVDIWLEPSESYKTISQDGTVNSKNKGFTEYLEIQYLGILNADFTKLLALAQSSSNQVRIYLDPTTYPSAFQLYKHIPSKMMASAKNFRLGQTGVQDLKMLFARKYE